jgi:predicted nucleic acid-binding protein
MSVEPGLIDANVLAYAVNGDAPHHSPSRALLNYARDPSVTLYVTSQILCEFYSVITNPRRVAVPSSVTEALRVTSAFLALPGIRVLSSPARSVAVLMDLLRRSPVSGGEIFDLQIVATMMVNNVQRIYIFDPRDFEIFPELIVVVPGSREPSSAERPPPASSPS